MKRKDQSDDGRDRRQRVQSVEAATGLLDAFVSLGGAATLGSIAAHVGMPPAKAHRYLASLKAAGYVEQVDQSGSYRLGRAATMLGLVALNQSDFIREAEQHLSQIRDTLEVTCFAAILGNQGATVVRQAVSSHSVALHVRLGSVLPLDRSATGLVFAAYLAPERVHTILGRNLEPKAKQLCAAVRRQGVSTVKDLLVGGISAVSVPVFGHGSHLEGVLTALGTTGSIDIAIDGAVARQMLSAAKAIGEVLGAISPLIDER